jgi:hypothetical protein
MGAMIEVLFASLYSIRECRSDPRDRPRLHDLELNEVGEGVYRIQLVSLSSSCAHAVEDQFETVIAGRFR